MRKGKNEEINNFKNSNNNNIHSGNCVKGGTPNIHPQKSPK